MRNLSPEVLADLDAATCNANELRLTAQLEPARYRAVDKIIQAAGGKWNRRARCHVFDDDARAAIDQIVLTGGVGAKQELGQFDSPPAVVARVMELAAIEPGMWVLEPSAGVGALAIEAIRAGGLLRAYEIDARRAAKLIVAVTALTECVATACICETGDFLVAAQTLPRQFDRCVMNPPFARQADIAHVLAAAACVKGGGRLVAVMSAAVRFRQDKVTRQFRDWLHALGGHVEDLPPGSFKVSGTTVNACIVAVDIP